MKMFVRWLSVFAIPLLLCVFSLSPCCCNSILQKAWQEHDNYGEALDTFAKKKSQIENLESRIEETNIKIQSIKLPTSEERIHFNEIKKQVLSNEDPQSEDKPIQKAITGFEISLKTLHESIIKDGKQKNRISQNLKEPHNLENQSEGSYEAKHKIHCDMPFGHSSMTHCRKLYLTFIA